MKRTEYIINYVQLFFLILTSLVVVASPQTSVGVRLSRIHFSPTSVGVRLSRIHFSPVGEKWMRDNRTPTDVCGEAIVVGYLLIIYDLQVWPSTDNKVLSLTVLTDRTDRTNRKASSQGGYSGFQVTGMIEGFLGVWNFRFRYFFGYENLASIFLSSLIWVEIFWGY